MQRKWLKRFIFDVNQKDKMIYFQKNLELKIKVYVRGVPKFDSGDTGGAAPAATLTCSGFGKMPVSL